MMPPAVAAGSDWPHCVCEIHHEVHASDQRVSPAESPTDSSTTPNRGETEIETAERAHGAPPAMSPHEPQVETSGCGRHHTAGRRASRVPRRGGKGRAREKLRHPSQGQG